MKALEEGNTENALRLVNSYGREAARQLAAATTPCQREAIAKNTLEFLEDRLHLARVMRAHFAAQIASLSQRTSYAGQPVSRTTWEISG